MTFSRSEPLLSSSSTIVAVGRNTPSEIERIVAGIASGCRKASLSLIGGETR